MLCLKEFIDQRLLISHGVTLKMAAGLCVGVGGGTEGVWYPVLCVCVCDSDGEDVGKEKLEGGREVKGEKGDR